MTQFLNFPTPKMDQGFHGLEADYIHSRHWMFPLENDPPFNLLHTPRHSTNPTLSSS